MCLTESGSFLGVRAGYTGVLACDAAAALLYSTQLARSLTPAN